MKRLDSHLADTYNALFPVADANRRLAELGGNKAVSAALSVIHEAGLEGQIGIRLLHKHNDISIREIMLESPLEDGEGFCLITRPAPINTTASDRVVCNSWQFKSTGYAPIEFSDSSVVAAATFEIDVHKDVFKRLSESLRDYRVDNLLGPCLNHSDYVMSHSPGNGAAFLEKTDCDNRANVVRFIMAADPAFTNSAKTKWHAKPTTDEEGKVVWTTVCNCFCSVFPQGGHQGTKTHRYSP